MENHFLASSHDSENNASFVTMATANQIISPEALYNNTMVNGDNQYYNYSNSQYTPHITSTPVVKSHHPTAIATNIPMFMPPHNNNYQQQQSNYTSIDLATDHIMNMEIDDYFTPSTAIDNNHMFSNTMQNVIYSPSSTSVTTNNSSIMMIDTMSPSSPTHNMMTSPEYANQAMDTSFISPPGYHQQLLNNGIDNHIFPETPIVPTNIGMHSNYSTQNILQYGNNNDDLMYHQQQQLYVDRKNRRQLPRRHTVSTPYTTNMNTSMKGKEPMNECMPLDSGSFSPPAQQQQQQQQQQPITKSRKSSLKAKRHRSLGKLDIYGSTTTSPPPIPDMATFDPLSAKLELWTHEQLLERVMELEKEKQVAQISMNKQNDECALVKSSCAVSDAAAAAANATTAPMFRKPSTSAASKVRSASHTDTEVDEDEDEEEETQICKWDTCTKETNSLDDLINHVKVDHIGSGKGNYYCLWKDCARKQKPFTKRHKMHNHLRTHTGERPFICQEADCGKRFSRPDSLTTHIKIHSNIRPYTCGINDCGKAYYHLRSLRKHERSHATAPEMPKSSSSSPPPPVPPVSMSAVTQTPTSSHPADELLVGRNDQQVFSDWGLSAQAAVFNVMNRENANM